MTANAGQTSTKNSIVNNKLNKTIGSTANRRNKQLATNVGGDGNAGKGYQGARTSLGTKIDDIRRAHFAETGIFVCVAWGKCVRST